MKTTKLLFVLIFLSCLSLMHAQESPFLVSPPHDYLSNQSLQSGTPTFSWDINPNINFTEYELVISECTYNSGTYEDELDLSNASFTTSSSTNVGFFELSSLGYNEYAPLFVSTDDDGLAWTYFDNSIIESNTSNPIGGGDIEGITHLYDNKYAALDENTGEVVVCTWDNGSNTFSIDYVIDTDINESGGLGLEGITYNPNTNIVYVIDETDSKIYSFNLPTASGPVTLGNPTFDLFTLNNGIQGAGFQGAGLFHLAQDKSLAGLPISEHMLVISEANEINNNRTIVEIDETGVIVGTKSIAFLSAFQPEGIAYNNGTIYFTSEENGSNQAELFTLDQPGSIDQFFTLVPNSTITVSGISNSSYTLSNINQLGSNKNYCWKIIGTNANGDNLESEYFYFRTGCTTTGQACDDGNICTENDVYDINCNCSGTYQDSDGDGICNAVDCAPNDAAIFPGAACEDDDECSTGTYYDTLCNCVGGDQNDADGDGICDDEDSCPIVPGEIGSACDDGNDCTIGETLDSNCICNGGVFQDMDDDGVCDAQDSCPSFPGVIGGECDIDNTDCLVGGTLDSNCNCTGATYEDTDGDGVCDELDCFPNNPNVYPGASCSDGDNCTTGETFNMYCQCVGGVSQDSDNDGVCDAQDSCPTIPGEVGDSCDDEDPCTTGETYDANCNCTGGTPEVGCGEAECDVINFNNAESGFGIWNDGGSDAAWYLTPNYAYSGAFSFMIRDDTETSVITTGALDLSNYSFITIDFSYMGWSMELGEDFWLQISIDGGTNYTTLEEWDRGDEFENGIRKFDVIEIPGPFTTDTRIRFRCDANANNDYVFLDDILITACTGTALCDIGSSCDDGDPCTDNDMYDTDCNCVGVIIDTDGDGTCDLDDVCSNIDDNYFMQPCDDGNPCTLNDVYTSDCECAGTWEPSCDNPCATFDFNDFSSGWGIWNDGGSDAIRTNNASFSFSDQYSLLIRDNTSTSVVTTDPIDLSNYGSITIGFTYMTYSMDNSTEDFWLQTSSDGGLTFTTVEEWNTNDEFQNGIREFDQVSIDGPFANDQLIRFRCDANGNGDLVFLDDILITVCDEICPNVGNACDDGDNCTTNDVFDIDCNCIGTISDMDGDGFCDYLDCEPNDADIYPGAPCDDGDECTENDIWAEADGPCYCLGNIIEGCESDCVTESNDNFESGLGNWIDGGIDCELIASYPNSGQYSVRIRDNSFEASSLTSNPYDLSTAPLVKVNFSYYPVGMEFDEVFYLEVSIDNGVTFDIIKTWASGTDFENGQRYFPSVIIPGNYYTTSTILRLRCNASINSDEIYLDDIVIEVCESTDGCEYGEPCDDGDNCTINDTFDIECNCIGVYQDDDNDGTCNYLDCEPNDNLIYPGAPCDDGDICTSDDTWVEADGPCYCIGNIIEGCESDCVTETNDGFETGLGNWIDGGIDCELIASNPNNGQYSVRIRDNSFEASSLTSNPYDFSNAPTVSIDFSFYPVGMESGEVFYLESSIDNGITYDIIQTWTSGIDFENEIRYFPVVLLPNAYYTSNTILRFRCHASINSDEIFLDDIYVKICEGDCNDVNYNDVESGWGIWEDGGDDAFRYNNSVYANSGNYSFRIQDNNETSVITTNPLDLSAYSSIVIDFTYLAWSMDNSNEDFWLQITDSNGDFYTVEEWNRGDEFENDVREFDQVTIQGPFGSTDKIRFRCDASGNADRIFLDDILITGCIDASGNIIGELITEDLVNDSEEKQDVEVESRESYLDEEFVIYPNPSNRSSDLFIQGENLGNVKALSIYGIDGKKLKFDLVSRSEERIQISTANFEAGTYLVQIITDSGSFLKQILLID